MQSKLFRKVLPASGLALCIFPLPNPVSAVVSVAGPRVFAQGFPDRMRRPLMPPGMRPAGMPPGPPEATIPRPQAPVATPQAAPPLSQPQPATSSPGLPPSLLNQPAKPADIRFGAAILTIHADNSSLNEILKDISTRSGMRYEGLGADERVFGSFGPAAPRDVLAALLNGTPYNIMMVGDLRNGAPRQLILTPAHPSGSPSSAEATPLPVPNQNAAADSSDAGDEANPDQPQSPQELYQQLQKMREEQHHPPQ